MTRLIIPDLQRKLELLIARGVLSGRDEIAARLGKSVKTINWWAHGSPTRQPGLIPSDSIEATVDLFALCFPAGTDHADIFDALARPAFEYEALLQMAWSMSWEELIAQHAVRDTGQVYLKPSDLNLVEVEARTGEHGPQIALDKLFRAEFRSDLQAPHVIAIQHAPGAIGSVPAAYDPFTAAIHLPPRQTDGSFAYMRERRDVGRHLFIAAQTEAIMPASLRAEFGTSLPIEAASLKRLTTHLIDLPRRTWRLYAIVVTVSRE